jgi:hypothetical protein
MVGPPRGRPRAFCICRHLEVFGELQEAFIPFGKSESKHFMGKLLRRRRRKHVTK